MKVLTDSNISQLKSKVEETINQSVGDINTLLETLISGTGAK